MENILSDRGYFITMTVLSVVALVGIFKIMGKVEKEKKDHREEISKQFAQEREIHSELESLNRLQILLSRKAEDFQIKYVTSAPHVLSADTLRKLFYFTPTIIDKQELEGIYTLNRKARRSVFRVLQARLGTESGELETYYRFVCTFEEHIQYLVEKAQRDFVVFLNLDYAIVTDSIDYHMCQTDTGLADWIKNWSLRIKEQLKEKLPLYEQPVDADTIMDIVDYQIHSLQTDGQHMGDAVANLHLISEDQQESVPTFLHVYLEDLVFQKFGIEIEQVNLGEQQITTELRQRLQRFSEMQNVVLALMISREEVLAESQGDISDQVDY